MPSLKKEEIYRIDFELRCYEPTSDGLYFEGFLYVWREGKKRRALLAFVKDDGRGGETYYRLAAGTKFKHQALDTALEWIAESIGSEVDPPELEKSFLSHPPYRQAYRVDIWVNREIERAIFVEENQANGICFYEPDGETLMCRLNLKYVKSGKYVHTTMMELQYPDKFRARVQEVLARGGTIINTNFDWNKYD